MMKRIPFLSLTAGALGLLTVFAVSGNAPAQSPAGLDVGVIENLGGMVPLDLTLNDEEGHPVKLGSLIDKPTILTLNYFRCAGICTPQLNGVVDVLNALELEPGKDFQVITVSFDPRDTPEIALQKKVNYLKQLRRTPSSPPFPPAAWRFLTGEASASRQLADAVGFKFQPQGNDFAHPAAIMVLSPKGKLTRYLTGVSYLPADLQLSLAEAWRGEIQPTLERTPALFGNRDSLRNFCYRYDPEKGRYVFNVTRVAGAVVVVLAAGFAAFLFLRGKPHTHPRSTP